MRKGLAKYGLAEFTHTFLFSITLWHKISDHLKLGLQAKSYKNIRFAIVSILAMIFLFTKLTYLE